MVLAAPNNDVGGALVDTEVGFLIVFGGLIVSILLFIFLEKNEWYLPPIARGGILVTGCIVVFIGFFSPILIEYYKPPKGFTTTINHHTIDAFTKSFNGIATYNGTKDPTGLGFIRGFIITVIITFIIGMFYIIRQEILIPLARSSKGLSIPFILFLVFVFIINVVHGDALASAQQNFADSLGGGKIAQQASQYFTVTTGIGVLFLMLGIAIIVVGTYAPRKPEKAEQALRGLAIAVILLIINIALVIAGVNSSLGAGNAVPQWLDSIILVGIAPSVANVVGAFIALSRADSA